MAIDAKVTGYSAMQVTLHWIVAVLVAFQFVAHDAIEEWWRSSLRGEQPPEVAVLAYLHVATGLLLLVLVLARIYLRLTRGAPSPPQDEARLLQLAGEAVHVSIYVLLLLLPITGAAAWFLGIEAAGNAHELLKTLLLAAIVLHVAGALFQHFVRRSQVLIRMFRPDRN